jgi:hypothetical protein
MLNRLSHWALALVVLTVGPGVGWADDTAKKPAVPAQDDDILEFLGSVDLASDPVQPDDASWDDYLSQTDINRVAKPGNPTVVAAKPPTPTAPPKPSTPGAKQDE